MANGRGSRTRTKKGNRSHSWVSSIASKRPLDYAVFMRVTEIPNFEQLSDLERLELAKELVASVRNPEALPPPVAHRLELERRWAEYERNPSIGLSQNEFWARIREG